LSGRELEVAGLVARGLTNREIAKRLFISERTADGHLEHIREKLAVTTRAQVAAWVVRQEVLSNPPAKVVPPNFPHYLTSFVGRQDELAALKSQVGHSRMLTLTGAGGAGKTRLAVELVTSLNAWPDSAWWVDLSRIDDPQEVPGAVRAALDLPGHGLAQDIVMSWLATRRALLVLDNCEHLVTACARFCDDALKSCPALSIIATSRERLGLSGEVVWPVAPMAVSDAIRLFEARGRLARPSFEVLSANLVPVTEICRQLDRSPLALELAAARLGMMTEHEILDQLSDRFRILRARSRSEPERHQALMATIDWSYRLLTAEEAGLFRRLSVFKGGFTVYSAQAICANPNDDVFAPLTGLVQKSMVEVQSTLSAGSRFWLLDSLMAYAEDRFREEGDTDLTLRRHHGYFSASAMQGAADDPERLKARRDWKRRERGNLQAALVWARANTEDMGLALAVNVAYGVDDPPQSLRRLLDLLDRSPSNGTVRLKALHAAAWHAMNLGDFDTAQSLAEKSVALAGSLGEPEELVEALNIAGTIQLKRTDLNEAALLFEKAASLLKNSTNGRLINTIRNSEGMLAVVRGDYVVGLRILTDCVAQARSSDDVIGLSYTLESLANAQLALGSLSGAAASWMESLRISREFSDHFNILLCLVGLSRLACECEEDHRALRIGAASKRMSEEWSLRLDAWSLDQLENAHHRSRTRLGAGPSENAWSRGWVMDLDLAIANALGEKEPRSSG